MKPLLPVSITPEFEERLLTEIDRENLRAELRAGLQAAYSGPKKPRRKRPAREVWQGKGHELARQVRDELLKAGGTTDELTAAFERACQRYVQKNGRRFTPKSLREGLRQWDQWNQGRHPRQF